MKRRLVAWLWFTVRYVRSNSPVVLDVAAFVALVAATWLQHGVGWSLYAAGVLLILAGLRAQS